MTTKTAAMLEAVHDTPTILTWSPDSGPCFTNPQSDLAGTEWPTKFDMDSYRIALVSLPVSKAHKGEGALQHLIPDKFLLLPFTWKELLTRFRTETSHSTSKGEDNIVRFGEVRIDLLSMQIHRSNQPVSLTAMEFKVLKFFVLNPNRVISRDELLNQVWGYECYPSTRTVDNHILKLRQKLELPMANPIHFVTVHGVGYRFVP